MKPDLVTHRDAAQATKQRAIEDLSDERVYTNLHRLSLLQHRARGISFLPKQPMNSLLSGRHASRIRGRGLNFEEIRNYHAGDDVRTIDWKVTARLRSPHTRVYTEERDRPVLLLVDQRIGMFYGTKVNMKSVTAAETAALSAWRVLDAGDRVGAIVFNDSRTELIRPQRSRNAVLRILKTIVAFNHELSADSPAKPNAEIFGTVIEQANRLAKHDYLVAIISDFFGFDDSMLRSLQRMRQHNDMISVLVHDPSASLIGFSRDFVITDGELQVEVDFGGSRNRKRIEETSSRRIAKILELQNKLQMPVLPLSTAEDAAKQLHRLLGRSGKITSASSQG